MFGVLRRSKIEQVILDAWKEYLDHLNNRLPEQQVDNWAAQGGELFANLLFAMAQDIGYKFDRVQLKRGSYVPIAHGELEQEQSDLRRALIAVTTGERPLSMNVVGFPIDAKAVEANQVAIQNVGKALESGVLKVEVKTNGS